MNASQLAEKMLGLIEQDPATQSYYEQRQVCSELIDALGGTVPLAQRDRERWGNGDVAVYILLLMIADRRRTVDAEQG